MSRIRTIKPDAFKSESLSSVPRGARWTFAGLWTYVDDAGRGRADTRLIKAELYPLDDATTAEDVDRDMSDLIDAGCLHTFMSGGKVYIHIPGFLTHQRINRPTKPATPACSCEAHGAIPDGSNEPQNDAQNHSISDDSVSPPAKKSGKGREGKGREVEKEGEARNDAPSTTPDTRPSRHCKKHPEGTDDPCRACGAARKAHEAWQKPTLSAKTTMCGDHPNLRAMGCPECAAESVPPPSDWRAS